MKKINRRTFLMSMAALPFLGKVIVEKESADPPELDNTVVDSSQEVESRRAMPYYGQTPLYSFTAGENIVPGAICYIGSDGTVQALKADDPNASNMFIGVAIEGGKKNETVSVIIK